MSLQGGIADDGGRANGSGDVKADEGRDTRSGKLQVTILRRLVKSGMSFTSKGCSGSSVPPVFLRSKCFATGIKGLLVKTSLRLNWIVQVLVQYGSIVTQTLNSCSKGYKTQTNVV